MTLSVASSIALSALRVAEVGMSVSSSNIANADVDGYTVKTVNIASTLSNGAGTGATVSSVTSGVDKYLYTTYLSANSDLGAAETTLSYTDQLQELMGSTTGSDDGGTSVATLITDLSTAVNTLASTPDSSTAKTQVVEAASNIADSLNTISEGIQSLRASADGTIDTDIDTVNDALETIDKLNNAIALASATGQSTNDLEDQRNAALKTISGLMDIKTTTQSNGDVYVYTASGTPLVNSSVHTIDYSAASTVTSGTSFDAISVDGEDITSEITSGEIGALLTLRDSTLVEAQSEVDNLASSVISAVNDAVADGSASPATDSLTSSLTVDGSDALSASGTVRIALVDDDGDLVSSSDIDLSTISTVDDLVTALNGISGITASIGSDGKLTIASTDGSSGVSIGALTSSIGSDGDSFSAYFGFNDVFTGSSASDITVSSALISDPSRLATSTLDSSATTAGDSALPSGSTTVASDLLDAVTGKTKFAAAGRLGSTTTTLADYAADVVSDFATRASDASTDETTASTLATSLSDTISSQTGVNLDEETAKLSDYQTLYSAAAQVMEIANEMFSTLLEAVQSAG